MSAVNLTMSTDLEVELPYTTRRRLMREVGRMVRAAQRKDRQKHYEVSLRLTTDAAIRELNRDYRDKDKPTDVLAFAQHEAPHAWPHAALGDIVISVETARRQAKRSLYAELSMLAAHGLCHLLGYDHRTDEEERVMNTRISALLKESKRRGAVRPA
jgi:probable rRNA maturation factor